MAENTELADDWYGLTRDDLGDLDPGLIQLVEDANAGLVSWPITLTVRGIVISGILIGAGEYVEELGRLKLSMMPVIPGVPDEARGEMIEKLNIVTL